MTRATMRLGVSATLLVVALAACRGGLATTTFPTSSGASVVALDTQAPVPPGETPPAGGAALIEGVLVLDDESGLALQDDDGLLRHVLWPFGYYAQDHAGGIRWLMDADGRAVAQAGDQIRLDGGEWGSDGWKVNGTVERVERGASNPSQRADPDSFTGKLGSICDLGACCPVLRVAGVTYQLLLPDGYQWQPTAAGYVIRGDDGTVVAEAGDLVSVRGGPPSEGGGCYASSPDYTLGMLELSRASE